MIRLGILSLLAFLSLGLAPYREPLITHSDGFTLCRHNLYQEAAMRIGASGDMLQGIARAESGETDSAIGDDGISMGRFQINERYHAQRAAAWGEYDPFEPRQAAAIAAHILRENAAYFAKVSRVADPSTWTERRDELTIASYRQGIGGVKRNGATYWYILRVPGKADRISTL